MFIIFSCCSCYLLTLSRLAESCHTALYWACKTKILRYINTHTVLSFSHTHAHSGMTVSGKRVFTRVLQSSSCLRTLRFFFYHIFHNDRVSTVAYFADGAQWGRCCSLLCFVSVFFHLKTPGATQGLSVLHSSLSVDYSNARMH